ncbi:MAG: hypothetical protein LBL65_01635 [Campylobacteraceae bacterium]|jgi:hypothetical protein|nr:hypothetical protein [Campylobacteraceae bacterium]
MESKQENNESVQKFRVSWIAYFWLSFWFVVKIAVLIGIYYLLLYFFQDKIWAVKALSVAFWVVVALVVIGLLFFILNFIMLRSILLYINNDGVWVYRGIFPWSKGTFGVKWRDVDSAAYKMGFLVGF